MVSKHDIYLDKVVLLSLSLCNGYVIVVIFFKFSVNITLTSKKFGFSRIACQLLLLVLNVHQSNFKTLTQLLAEERNCDSPMGFSARNFHSSFSVKYKLVSRNRKWRKRSSPAS